MPIFDNELLGNTSDRSYTDKKNIDLSSIQLPEVNTNPNMGGFESYGQVPAKRGLTVQQISEMSRNMKDSTSWDGPGQSISQKELIDNKRYPMYKRGIDLENVYGLQQSAVSQLGNGLAKMGVTAAGTFAQSFMTIPNTVSAIKNGSMAELSGSPEGGLEAGVDTWLKNMEDYFPNYVTRKEKESPFLAAIPGFAGSANFWGNSIIKNIGFTVGAIGGALVQDAAVGLLTEGFGAIPLVSAQLGKAALWMNKIFTGANDLEKVLQLEANVAASAKTILSLKKMEQLAAAERVTTQARYGLNLYGSSRTEAAIEARDGYAQVKEELTNQYKAEHFGEEPTPEELAKITDYATDAMNTRFGINMVLLTVSNAIQFDNILKPFTSAQKGLKSTITKKIEDVGQIGLKEGSIDVFEKKVAGSFKGRVWDSVKPKLANVFSEGVYEEGGQFAAERGTYDYYTRKYKNPTSENKETWNTLNEVTNSTLKGLEEQFGSTEGLNNMLVGGLSAMITGGLMGKIDQVKGKGKDARLQSSINMLNNFGLTGILENKYSDTVDSVGIAKDMQDAADSGDIFKYKNLKDQMFFNFVNSRIPSGMHDVTIEQLNMLKELDQDEFAKMFNIDFNAENKKTVSEYVDRLIEKANTIQKTSESLNKTFKNPFTFHGDPKTDDENIDNKNFKTFELWKTELAYQSSVPKNVNERLSSIEQEVLGVNSSLSNNILEQLTNGKSLVELATFYEEQANALNSTITEFTSAKDKRAIKNKIKELRTLSEKINLSKTNNQYTLKDFHTLLNFELNNQDSSLDNVVPMEQTQALFKFGEDINQLKNEKKNAATILDNLINQEGFEKYFNEAENLAQTPITPTTPTPTAAVTVPVFKNKQGISENVEIGREYDAKSLKKSSIRKLSNDRFQVTDARGNKTFYKTRDKAKEAADEIDLENKDLLKLKVLAINDDGTIKVEDLSGNIINIDADKLFGYSRIESAQEKLIKANAVLKAQQDALELRSGTVVINTDTSMTTSTGEGFLKEASVLFTSSTSQSEDSKANTNPPHAVRSRVFLNNVDSFPADVRSSIRAILVTAKQIEAQGLTGLVQLSYGLPADTALNRIPDVNDINNGFVAQVYVIQENGKTYFVSQEGKKLSEVGTQVSMDEVVFQTMPTTSLTYADKSPRYRAEQKDLAEGYQRAYIDFRNTLFTNDKDTFPVNDFVVSRGIPIENKINGVGERNPVGGILISEDKIYSQEGLIVIATTGTVSHNGQAIPFPNGTPVLRYGSTLQFLNNRTFKLDESHTIYHVLNNFAQGIVAQVESGSAINIQNDYSTFLQNVLYWRKSKVTTGNQIHINVTDMTIQLGAKSYPMSDIASYKKEIIDGLQDTYLAVNNTSLLKETSEKFYQYQVNSDDTLSPDDYIEWDNYQSYLLSSKFPNGIVRNNNDIPLTTSVAAPTTSVPYSYKQKYSTMQIVEMETPKAAPQAPQGPIAPVTPTAPMVGNYNMGGTVVNTYTGIASGPILFTATLDAAGEALVLVQVNDTVTNASNNPTVLQTNIVPILKSIGDYRDTDTPVQLVQAFAAMKIASEIRTLQQKAPTPAAAPIVTPAPVVTPAPTPPAAGGNKFGGFGGSLPGYRQVGGQGQRMTDAEFELFKVWHAENIPNIPFEMVENLITMHNGEKAWGVFENGVAKFVKGGLRATEYHEIFEGIYKGMLSEQEQQALLAEFKDRSGVFTDRASKKQIKFSEATDLQAKERIADDFADFRQGKLPARSLGEFVRNLYNRIMAFFKSFIGKPSLKKSLFNAINTGEFKNKKLSPDAVNSFAEYRAVEGLTEAYTHEFVQDMTARAAGILYREGQKSLLFSPEGITSSRMFNTIESEYLGDKNVDGFNKRELLGDVAWEQLKQKTVESLRTLGINFTDEGILGINSEGSNKNDYAAEPFATDWKKASTGAIKFSMATLLQVQATNQEKSISLKMPDPYVSSIGGYKLVNFSQAFATTLSKLSNTTSISKAVKNLLGLAQSDAAYVRLFARVGGNLATKEIHFDKFSSDDWRYFIQFMQTFTKQKPDALIQYQSVGEVYTAPANLYTAVKQTQRGWIENIKTLGKAGKGIIKYSKVTKTYQVDMAKIKEIPVKLPKEMIAFLNELGIDFTIDLYNRLKTKGSSKKTNEQIRFADAVSSLKTYLGTNQNIMSVSGKTLGINSQLSTLATLMNNVANPNQESTHFGVENQRMGSFAENNAPSLFENEFNEVDTLEELLLSRPELNDVYSRGSQVLKKGGLFFDKNGNRIKEMKVSYIDGTKFIDENKGVSTSKMTIGERFTQEINQNIDGNYYVLIPADGSTEWMMNFGNNITFQDVMGTRGTKKTNDIFREYLLDDIRLALDLENRVHLTNIKGKGAELRFFKDILYAADLAAINQLIAIGSPIEAIEDYIKANLGDINDSIQEYIDGTVDETKEILFNNNQVFVSMENVWSYSGINEDFLNKENLNKYKLTTEEFTGLIKFVNTNYIINNIEYHKVLFGDPYQFAVKKGGVLDETKRIKSFLSPRRTTFDTPEFNTHLNQEMNNAGAIALTPNDPGFKQFKSYASTVTFTDITISGSLVNSIGGYEETNEADGVSWIMDGSYREVKLKNGQWSDEAEAWHQWQLAYTRQNLSSYTYTNEALKKQDAALVATKEPYHKIEILKPIVSGNKFNKNQFDLVLDKFSQLPVYYSMVKGTAMEKLYVKMFAEKRDYAIVESGRKVGAEELHPLYNTDGTFNEEAFNNEVKVAWKAYGIQVETTTEGPKQQTRGSQLTKLASMDLYNNGVASSPEAEAAYEENKTILDALHDNAYNNLLEKLGVSDIGNGFILEDGQIISNTLMHEMGRRALSDNTKDAIQLDENNVFKIPFEAAPSYIQIRNILYSMIDKSLISPKMSGGGHVQAPVTMFENAELGRGLAIKTTEGWKPITKEQYAALTPAEQGKVMLTDNTLKFYTKEEPYCEVMLPHWFKGKLGKHSSKTDAELIKYLNNTEEGRSILSGIGFRIPTQALSSVETFRVKGFLPAYMGSTVVVPAEITSKSGSDFDIDKLNMYLKSIYLDANGEIKLVKYLGSKEATDTFFGRVFDDSLENKILKKDELLEALDIAMYNLPDTKGLLKYYKEFIDSLAGPYVETEQDVATFERVGLSPEIRYAHMSTETGLTLERLTDENIQGALRADYLKKMYKSALENAYYESLERLVTLPENFINLVTPIGDAGLKDLSIKLDELRGYDETKIKNRLLSRNYMTSLRNSFLTAKRWIGIAAVNITGLSLKQKSKIYIDPARIQAAPEKDIKWLGDGSIALKHNTVLVNNIPMISLSGTTVAGSNEKISERLSGYATSFVDVAKDDYITKIIQSDLAIGTFMFLENIGAGEQAAYFMNQPIISEYMRQLDSTSQKNLFNEKQVSIVLDKFPGLLFNAPMGFDLTKLEDNIRDYYTSETKLSPQRNTEQHHILFEFLKYAKMAQYNFKFTQAINYDTTSFRSAETLTRKQIRTEEADETNIINTASDILNTTFIGLQSKLLSKATEAMGAILKLDQTEFREITNTVLRTFAENEYLSGDKYEKIAVEIKAAFIDYIVQTKTGLSSRIEELLINEETSVVYSLAKAKVSYPGLQILKDLEIVTGDRVDGAKSIKLLANIREAYDENLYTGYMRELRDFSPEMNALYKDIVSLSILQGTYASAISIRNIIPIEDYSNIVAPIIDQLVSNSELVQFTQGWYQRNNFKVNDIIPIFPNVKFWLASPNPVGERVNMYGDHMSDVYQYISTSMFPNILNLNVKSSDRRIMLLSEQYDGFYLKNDYLKTPRVVKDRFTGDSVDMKTGMSVSAFDYAVRKAQGDPSLSDVYGYQKVKLPNGEALIHYKLVKNKMEAFHVYKLINLYGDGERSTENYNEFKPSIIDNGSVKIENEIPNADIIQHFGGKITKKDINITPTIVKEEEKTLPLQTNNIVLEEIARLEQKIQELQSVQSELRDNSVEVQIANRLPKLTPASVKKETRLKTGSNQDIKTSLLSNEGVTVNKAAHDIWEDNFRESGLLDTEQIKDIIIDILNVGSIQAYKEGFDGTEQIANLKEELREKIKAQRNIPKTKTKAGDKNQLSIFEQEKEEPWEKEDNECDMPF